LNKLALETKENKTNDLTKFSEAISQQVRPKIGYEILLGLVLFETYLISTDGVL
jgi:hypothetical protein